MGSAEATRIFLSVSPKNDKHAAAWDFPEKMIQPALDLATKHKLIASGDIASCFLVAVERWQRILIVFDVNNCGYNPDAAHITHQNDLPVVAVYFSEKEVAVPAPNSLKEEVNTKIREIHDYSGHGSRPPFRTDHADGNVPTYPNPRSSAKT